MKVRIILVLAVMLILADLENRQPYAYMASNISEPEHKLKNHNISFPISCNDETQSRFNNGLFLLHNMMYKQAQSEFESGIVSDETCAMLYWGVAMTQFQPKWPGEPSIEALKAGANAVDKARSIAAANPDVTHREKGYIEAAGAYYKEWETTDRNTRKMRWRDAHGMLASMYPEDAEAQIFFALATVTTTAPNDYEGLLHSAKKLENILEKNPDHPGVLHYLLHACDNPVYARRGVQAARAYENVAPDAPHALHMPSHIYVRLGEWDQVAAWNTRSRDAAKRQPVDGNRVSRHFLHALDYLVYGYLQVADDEKARLEMEKVSNEIEWQLNSGPGAYALAAIPARYAIERRDWQQAAELRPRTMTYTWDAYPWAEAITYAARGLGAARNGDTDAALVANEELNRLKALTNSGWWRGRIDVQRDVIAGWIAYEQGQTDEAVKLLRRASEQELAAGKQSVEPGHVVNAVEQLGDMLIMSGRFKEALEIYQRSLEESPKRLHSLFGAGNAAEKAGMDEDAAIYYSGLVELADEVSQRPELKQAAEFLKRIKSR